MLLRQNRLLHKKHRMHKHHVLHKSNVLAGPVQGLFAAYRIALSMVAGGTRRRRFNILSDIMITVIIIIQPFSISLYLVLII